MESVQTWGEAITISLLGLWERFVNFLPALVGAVLVFVAGWIVAVALGKVVEHIVVAWLCQLCPNVERKKREPRLEIKRHGVKLNKT